MKQIFSLSFRPSFSIFIFITLVTHSMFAGDIKKYQIISGERLYNPGYTMGLVVDGFDSLQYQFEERFMTTPPPTSTAYMSLELDPSLQGRFDANFKVMFVVSTTSFTIGGAIETQPRLDTFFIYFNKNVRSNAIYEDRVYLPRDPFMMQSQIISSQVFTDYSNEIDYSRLEYNEVYGTEALELLRGVHFEMGITTFYSVDPGNPFDPIQATYYKPISLSYVNAKDCATSTLAKLSWTPITGARWYDVEYTFYERQSAVGKQIDNNFVYTDDAFQDLFYQHATRVQVSNPELTIQIAYPEGYMFYRMRTVSRGADSLILTGPWSYPGDYYDTRLPGIVFNSCYKLIDFDELNTTSWVSKTDFAEEAKKTTSILYADDFGRPRQSQAVSYANDAVVISETLYDGYGRPFTQVMPYPETGCIANNIFYRYDLHDIDGSVNPLTWKEIEDGVCMRNPKLSEVKGSARYYSPSNSTSQMHRDFIPDANGYTFAITKYADDPMNRPIVQSGIGEAFSMGMGHEARSFYGQPTQKELDRLFGNEAGFYEHYQKNMVIDPNGQVALAYIDRRGNTIATSLAGPAPANVSTLSYLPSQVLDTTIVDDNFVGDDYISASQTIMVAERGIYQISYLLQGADYSPHCLPDGICYECPYDLKISVKGQCIGMLPSQLSIPNPIEPEVVDTVYTVRNFTYGGILDTLCAQPNDSLKYFLSLDLPVGEYIITKVLSVNMGMVELYADEFMAHTACLPDIDTIATSFTANVQAEMDACDVYVPYCDTFYLEFKKFVPGVHGGHDIEVTHVDTLGSCEEELYGPCISMLEKLKRDVIPGGKYFRYRTTSDTFHVSVDSLLYSVLDNRRDPGVYVPMQVVLAPGYGVDISDLNIKQYVENFKIDWSEQLVKKHPEYCLFKSCIVDATADSTLSSAWFDRHLMQIDYEEAEDLGYLDHLYSLMGADPFFSGDKFYKKQMRSLLRGSDAYGGVPLAQLNTVWLRSYFQFMPMVMFGDTVVYTDQLSLSLNNAGLASFGLCQNDKDALWKGVRSLYLGYKQRVKSYNLAAITTGCDPDVVSLANLINGTDNTGLTTIVAPADYEIVNDSIAVYSPENQIDTDSAQVLYDAGVMDGCHSAAAAWIQELSACPTFLNAQGVMSTTTYNGLFNAFMAHCSAEVGTTSQLRPFGQFDMADVIAILDNYFVGSNFLCDSLCSPYLITWPGTEQHSFYLGPRPLVAVDKNDNCQSSLCDKLHQFQCVYNAYSAQAGFLSKYPSFLSYLNSLSDVSMTQAELDELLTELCLGTCNCKYFSEDFIEPPYLDATEDRCQTCAAVANAWNSTCTSANLELRASRLNGLFGLQFTSEEYLSFIAQCSTQVVLSGNCGQNGYLYLCPRQLGGGSFANEVGCGEIWQAGIDIQVTLAYQASLDSIRKAFIANMLSHCLEHGAKDTLYYDSYWREYHFTLYYYDQAGNLVKTVPPIGVSPVTSFASLKSINNFREGLQGAVAVYPTHTMATKYWYNSMNEVIKTVSPDAGVALSWYDLLGRPVASQTASQLANVKYGYVIYDALGRIKEGGEQWSAVSLVHGQALTLAQVDAHVASLSSRHFVSLSVYDYLPMGFESSGISQANGLRTINRVVAALSYKNYDINYPMDYDYGTFYQYDLTGNVERLVQRLQEGGSGVPILEKTLDYDYDLVSGKVNNVYYQRGKVDQYCYKYRYDLDNRLVEALSGRDTADYRDASYVYYKHGPLARKELGKDRVQGIDFAYTLQGWLKAINGGEIDRDSDMGGDGFKNVQSAVGNFIPTGVIDALAMTLGYYEGDYAAIGGDAVELANGYNSTVAKNLYNGNIRHATYQMYGLGNEVMRYDYGYDQLQRLVAMDSKTLANEAAPGGVDGPLSWTGAAFGGYREAYSYDANGNILTLNRRARRSNGVSALMDSLVYNYTFTGVNMKNRLKDVSDFAVSVTPNSNFATDIEHSTVNQGFVYDSDGRMSVDRKERMGVYWTPFDKPYLVIDTVPNPFKINTVNYGYDALHNRVEKIVSADTSRTAYIRDASGNIMAQYELKQGRWLWTEQHLYGSERLGVDHVLDSVWTDTISAFTYVWVSDPICQCMVQREVRTDSLQHHVRYARAKKYEITNHLGNVLVVVSDAAIASSNTDFLLPDVVSATDYFPFGMEMPNRSFSADAYSFGFNTQMESPEILPGHTTAMFWEYDARIGRRWELDPKTVTGWSGYACLGDSPIGMVDILGDIFDEAADNEALKAQNEHSRAESLKLNTKIESLVEQISSLSGSSDKKDLKKSEELEAQLKDYRSQKKEFDDAITEVLAMQSSEVKFKLVKTFSGGGVTRKNGVIMIASNGSTHMLAHELKHGHQFLEGTLSFDRHGSPGLLYDVTDEIFAYRRQYAFEGGSLGLIQKNGTKLIVSNMRDINREVVYNIAANDGLGRFESLYRDLPSMALGLKSELTAEVLKAFRINASPQNIDYSQYLKAYPETCEDDFSILCK